LNNKPIGIFDSGYGGLTVLKEIQTQLPQYDFLYLGDNARAPYGTRSYESIYEYTWQCVQWFFGQGCELVVLACNTASAKALRTIQQKNLPVFNTEKRVLGVIRPTTEIIGTITKTNNIGILATKGTVVSNSYPIEIAKFYPNVQVHQQACPMWVPLIENNEQNSQGAAYFIKKDVERLLAKNANIDTIVLACTHYPLLHAQVQALVPAHVRVISQGNIVAKSLQAYLSKHATLANKCSKNGKMSFFTTDSTADFDEKATAFYGKPVKSQYLHLA
jgi:glutamate racemase